MAQMNVIKLHTEPLLENTKVFDCESFSAWCLNVAKFDWKAWFLVTTNTYAICYMIYVHIFFNIFFWGRVVF